MAFVWPHSHTAAGAYQTLPSLTSWFCMQYCRREVAAVLELHATVRADIFARIRQWSNVNYFWHGLKRAPVAFVPFGVSAVNLAGLSRLVGRVLEATGASHVAFACRVDCVHMCRPAQIYSSANEYTGPVRIFGLS